MSVKDYTGQGVQAVHIIVLAIGIMPTSKSILSRDYRFISTLVKIVSHSIAATNSILGTLLLYCRLTNYTIDYS